jgi:hypothetical protein
MTRPGRVVFCGILTLALAVPVLVEAQGRGRGGRSAGVQVGRGGGRVGPQLGRMGSRGRGGMRGRGGNRGRGADRPNRSAPEIAMGSIRVKASPETASVFVDGERVGKVADFDGLTNHLKLVAGIHVIEIRAEGYETYRSEVNVADGKTLTERATLKKIK